MAFQDRYYYRDSGSGAGNPLMWLLTGSVPLFTVFGIRVRMHASLLIVIILVLIFGLGQGFTWQDRLQSMSVLFLTVLLHEFGHCFACRWVGGEADEIMMTPIGGLAFARPPHRWVPSLITTAAGPAVNVLICLVCGTILYTLTGWLPWNPFHFKPIGDFHSWLTVWRWAMWIYQVNYLILLFNLLPIFPMDGGRMLQEILWPIVGYYKSMLFACTTGMVGGVIMAAVGIAIPGGLLLTFIAISGFINCMQMRRMLLAAGPEEFADSTDYSAAYETYEKPRKRSRWAARRAIKIARAERMEQQKIDQILAKVSAQGMQSLSWWERRTLKKATVHQRQRDQELSKIRRG
ncbi:MAG TPA: M50 family metallopeptidase [Tepidisphaeraceae bacterium]|jgi:Zn-dependent protease